MSTHQDAINVLKQSKLPNDVVDKIDDIIKNENANKIINNWYNGIKQLNNALRDYCTKKHHWSLGEIDIRLLFTLRKMLKCKTYQFDIDFWLRIIDHIEDMLIYTRCVQINNRHYTDISFLFFYYKIIKDVLNTLKSKRINSLIYQW